MTVTLVQPSDIDEALRASVHEVVHAVVSLGGAVGYIQPPGRPETDGWLSDVCRDAARGDAALAIATVGGRVEALGSWRRGHGPVTRITATVQKVMAHPRARGTGLARAVMAALMADAGASGVEVLALGVRGNNHVARRLYESLGFTVWGVLPNSLAVGTERFDDVRMVCELGRPPGVRLTGSEPTGPGSSRLRGELD
jgi:ribosomal protein S18 acetylase RimI-like enzyme